MTQDPNGQPPVTGNVVRGEVIPDNEGNVVPPTVPMTRFQKVASVVRGDRTDPAIPVDTTDGADPDGTSGPEASQADPEAPGPQRGRHAADETLPQDVVAVRSPDADDRDYWDDDPDETDESGPDQAADQAGPGSTQTQDPALSDATARPDADATAGPADAADAAADEAPRPDDADAPAAAAPQALRPGELDSALADFSDLTFGSLLPDAAEFRARWQQVQFRFVDDPRGSVTEAADVISQLTVKLEAAIAERQRAIAERQRALRERWGEGMSADTESLRETLLIYRAFLDQLTRSDGRVS
jgi:hypothetical protein